VIRGPVVVGAGLAVKSRPVFGAVAFAVVGAPGQLLCDCEAIDAPATPAVGVPAREVCAAFEFWPIFVAKKVRFCPE